MYRMPLRDSPSRGLQRLPGQFSLGKILPANMYVMQHWEKNTYFRSKCPKFEQGNFVAERNSGALSTKNSPSRDT